MQGSDKDKTLSLHALALQFFAPRFCQIGDYPESWQVLRHCSSALLYIATLQSFGEGWTTVSDRPL